MKNSARKHVSRLMIMELFASVIIFIGITLYRRTDYYTYSMSYEHIRAACTPGDVAIKAAAIFPNYSRNHSIFLQLSDYFWTQTSSLYALPFGTKGSEELIMQALACSNYYDIPQEIDRLQCRRCVVVGNGYRMKNSSLGEIIDKYDIVIRLNNGPVHNYKKDVGSKTTLRLFYPESAHFNLLLDNNPETLMVLVPFKGLDLKWLKTILNDDKRNKTGFWRSPPLIWKVKPENIRILNPYFMNVAATKLLMHSDKTKKISIKPTTGLMAISFAIHFCDLVHIAGFGYPAPSNKTPFIHYYDKSTIKLLKKSGHKVPLEALAIKNLLRHNIIKNLTYF
ncbi:CMP-N-acetylneuraminate-beta-galactosamide-alpha-2,3-sialyltransferase 4-like [Bufo bufo]|uniref:CMP-N-acetylneuraminate-beta-galactosamide- alpha-2,3-sialyltransferase 4-like n=1 Tax=Bufo bufo TaxID=8384 RepID=UPI001ABE9016|nr:CMP-N-acetylneuraminate-beta-galactosamide-alpha-2,3-sialyltransferase 4-like [Bufo bufo]